MFSIFTAVAEATEHSTCFNYFMKKDGCVLSSADSSTRCKAPAKDHPAPVKAFSLGSQKNPNQKKSPPSSQLIRRYDAKKSAFPIGSGDGICGFYNSTSELGVCLWSGAEQNEPTVKTAGWLNGLKTSNCGKRIHIQRTGKPETVQHVQVLDGCGFNTVKLDEGCFQIGVTVALFNKFKPSADEQASQLLFGGLTWDFDNLDGKSTQQGPV
ncbi:hypothetical protein VP01_767g5 [Puccinia sorghi]|uniref:Uncharacterized protein n=1 Tax=Puccinia sorghi TaxID=27349 RepID=A0A0L6UBM6_9BASI|nr:hypothetical protein VP01_767g5 [Puccinia sorghi]